MQTGVRKISKENSKKNPYLTGIIIVIVVISGLIAIKVKKTRVSSKVKEVPATVLSSSESRNLKGLLSRASCEGVDGLCEDIELTGPKEGLVSENGSLYVFVSLDHFPLGETHKKFQKVSQREKDEMILARYGTHPDLLSFAKDQNLLKVFVIGFTSLDEFVNLRSQIRVEIHKVPELEFDVYDELFGEIFYSGRTRHYGKYLKKNIFFDQI